MDINKVIIERQAASNELYRDSVSLSEELFLKWIKPLGFHPEHERLLKVEIEDHLTILFETIESDSTVIMAFPGGVDQMIIESFKPFQMKVLKIHNRYKELLSRTPTVNPTDEIGYNPIKWGVDKIKKLKDSGVITQLQAEGFYCLFVDTPSKKIIWESSPWQLDLILNKINRKFPILKESEDSIDYIINNFSDLTGNGFTRKNLLTIINKPRDGKNTDKKLSFINNAFDN